MIVGRAIAACAACCFVIWPSAAFGDRIATTRDISSVDASDGRVVWSEYDARRREYRLVEMRAARRVVLPVRPRGVAFDLDIGRDAAGRVVAAYSRCKTEPSDAYSQTLLPTYATGRGCRLYLYDFRSRRERSLDVPGARGASIYLPAVAGERVVFARRDSRRGHRSPALYVADLGTRRLRRLQHGRLPGPTAVDIDGARIAYTWDTLVSRCTPDEPPDIDGVTRSEVWIAPVDGAAEPVDEACWGDPTSFFFSPSLTDAALLYARRLNTSDEANAYRYRRYSPGDRSFADAAAPPFLVSFVVAGDQTLSVRHRTDRSGGPRLDSYALHSDLLPQFVPVQAGTGGP
jgi:hypothetical protein